MKRTTLLFATAMLAGSLLCPAQEKGYWRPANSTAEGITGDIAISDTKITINFTGFTIAEIRQLVPAEASAVFDVDLNAGGRGNLYRLNVPGTKRFLHHNSLCGSEDTQWMVTYVLGHSLQIAFFSGPDMPKLTLEALASTSDRCGTFSYAR